MNGIEWFDVVGHKLHELGHGCFDAGRISSRISRP
jgi:hypothetical protein